MMSLHRLPERMNRDLGDIIARKAMNTGDVVFHWDASAAPADRNLEEGYAAPDLQTATVPGLIHYVSVRSGERGFAEIQAGDAILTFTSDVAIAGKRGLYFTLPDGKDYVQSTAGKAVVQYWDAFIGGAPLSVTLLLRLKS